MCMCSFLYQSIPIPLAPKAAKGKLQALQSNGTQLQPPDRPLSTPVRAQSTQKGSSPVSVASTPVHETQKTPQQDCMV